MCNSTDLPEFEIISLLEEQLPVYRLRADTVYGYDHDDWLHTPLVAPDARLDLTTEQIEETLKYFCESGQSRQLLVKCTGSCFRLRQWKCSREIDEEGHWRLNWRDLFDVWDWCGDM